MIALAALALAPGFGEIALQDFSGAPRLIRADQARATVVVFISAVCPISQEYERRYAALFEAFSPRGVQFAFVYSNRTESLAEVRQHAASGRFAFPVYRDPGNLVADLLAAKVTPTAALLDSNGNLVYRGRIDDSVNPARVKDHSLANAIRAVLSGKAPKTAATEAFG